MAGRGKVLLAVGAAALLLGVALWRYAPAARVAPSSAARAEVAQSLHPAAVPAQANVAHPARGRPAEAGRVNAFEALKQRARAGDAVAQRELAEVYDACLVVNADRERFMAGVDAGRRTISDTDQLHYLEKVARERIALCDAVDGGAIVPSELIRGWYAQAAGNGDLAARLMDNAFKHKNPDAAESARLLEEVLGSKDPAAVFARGNTLGPGYQISPGDPAAALMTGDLAGTAWQVAGCRMGYNCDVHMETLCLMISRCTGDDFESYIRGISSAAQRRELDRRVTEIVGLVEGQ